MIEAVAFACAGGWLANLSISVYAHRTLAHRAVALHPIAAHFFRFSIWLTTGTRVRRWVAVHRKHHAFVDREGDPHSPVVHGIYQILFNVYKYYHRETLNEETVSKFGYDCPDDWIERHLYGPRGNWGLLAMLALDLGLFGPGAGLVAFAVHILWMPWWAGVINGIGHHGGYRNFETRDASRNIVPVAFVVGGEELHNNHHRYPRSAKFSVKWWEFDVGWMVIRLLSALRLARNLHVFDRSWPVPALAEAGEEPQAAAVAVGEES